MNWGRMMQALRGIAIFVVGFAITAWFVVAIELNENIVDGYSFLVTAIGIPLSAWLSWRHIGPAIHDQPAKNLSEATHQNPYASDDENYVGDE